MATVGMWTAIHQRSEPNRIAGQRISIHNSLEWSIVDCGLGGGSSQERQSLDVVEGEILAVRDPSNHSHEDVRWSMVNWVGQGCSHCDRNLLLDEVCDCNKLLGLK